MTLPLTLYRAATALLAGPLTRLARRRHRDMGADPARFAERQGLPSRPRPPGKLIWVHAASVGEVLAVAPLAEQLARDARAYLLVTTVTATGGDAVARRLPTAIHQFLPQDGAGPVSRFLTHWHPDLGVFVESDLWPRLVAATQCPLAVVNARPSRSRARWPRTTAALMAPVRLITVQSDAVAGELTGLGLTNVRVTGDLKSAAAAPAADATALAVLRARIGNRPVWAAISTHAADEGPVLMAHRAVLAQRPDALLILAPRHPDRAGQIKSDTSDLNLAQHSLGQPVGPATQILLADTLGDTGLWFRLAPVVFMGGSFGDEGGHNPYEPAACGTAILTGPRIAHFAAAYRALSDAGAALICPDANTFTTAVVSLLNSPEVAIMGQRAKTFHAAGAGAVDRTLPLLRALLP